METLQNIEEKVVLFRTSYDVVQARGSLKEATCKWWKVSEHRVLASDYVFSIIDDIVRDVYIAEDSYKESDDGNAYPHFEGVRAGFIFKDAPENIKQKYVGKTLPVEYQKWGQNPIRYTF